MSQPPAPGPNETEEMWRGILTGTDPRYRRWRSVLKLIPSQPRCKMCAAPFAGPGRPFMRLLRRDPWSKNPKYCTFCFTVIQSHFGGAEIDGSYLFADVRGSTALAEGITATAFRTLLNRFYETATHVLVDHDAIVDKFVGDEVIGIFIPATSGDHHAAQAIDAGLALLRATGHADASGPWVPIGIGVHTGQAYVGAVGEPPVTEMTALGDVVNTTARLASAAGAGELLISAAAAAAAGFDISRLERRELELKGKRDVTTVAVARVDGQLGGAA